MLRRHAMALFAWAFALSFVHQQEAGAQVQRYRPATTTISPYLNLTRTNFRGGLPNYYSLVRPQLQQQSINRYQQAVQASQAVQIGSLENELQRAQLGLTPTGKASSFMTDGVRFQTTAPYYVQPQITRRR